MRKSVVLVAAGLAAVLVAQSVYAQKMTNRQIADKYFDILDSKKIERLAEVEAADVSLLTPMGPMKGTAAHQKMMKGFAGAFPNFKHRVARCVDSGDVIACEGTFAGDNTGPMQGPDGKTMPATNKHVELPFAGLARIKDGKIVELHVYFDNASFMAQLGAGGPPQGGAAPAPAAAPAKPAAGKK